MASLCICKLAKHKRELKEGDLQHFGHFLGGDHSKLGCDQLGGVRPLSATPTVRFQKGCDHSEGVRPLEPGVRPLGLCLPETLQIS